MGRVEETMTADSLFQEHGSESVIGDAGSRKIHMEETLKGQQPGP